MTTGEWWYWNIVSKLRDARLSIGVGSEDCERIMDAIKDTSIIEGDIAEVGVAEGGSATIMCEAKREKIVHLFDTFEGLPELREEDKESSFHKGQYPADFEKLKEFFAQYKNVFLYKGIFPETSEPIKEKKFSFVHLDADLYLSTLESLEFFWSRMNKGGIIISHDYQTEKGIRKAFEDALPEIEVLTPGKSQGMVIKI